MNKQLSYLSLKGWGIVIISACLIQCILHYTFVYYTNLQRPFDPIFSYILNSVSNYPEDTKRVLVIGSSLFGHGVLCHDDTVYQNKLGETPIAIFKAWQDEDPFNELFSSEKYLDSILNIKPNLICIQTELAAVHLKWMEFESTFFQNISIENRRLRSLILKHYNPNFNLQFYCNPKGIPGLNTLDTLSNIPVNRPIKTQEELSQAFHVLQALQNANIKIVIVDIPRPQSTEDLYKTDTFITALNTRLKQYKTNLNIEYWAYDGRPMYHKDFIDQGHLNTNGKTYYSKWLLNTIKTKAFY